MDDGKLGLGELLPLGELVGELLASRALFNENQTDTREDFHCTGHCSFFAPGLIQCSVRG